METVNTTQKFSFFSLILDTVLSDSTAENFATFDKLNEIE